MSFESQVVTPEPVTHQSVADDTLETDVSQADDTGASEQVAESDEQKAERLVKERQVREKRNSRKLQERFNELTARAGSAERRAEQALELLQRTIAAPKPANQPTDDGPPRRDQYPLYEDWLEAKTSYTAERRADARFQSLMQNAQTQTQVQSRQNIEAQLEQNWARSVQEYSKTNPDFVERIADSDVHIPDESLHFLKALPGIEGTRIADAIAKDPRIAEQLNAYRGNPYLQSHFLGQLRAQVAATPQVSTAPRPGTPVGSRGGSSGKETLRMTPDQYYDHIMKRKKRG